MPMQHKTGNITKYTDSKQLKISKTYYLLTDLEGKGSMSMDSGLLTSKNAGLITTLSNRLLQTMISYDNCSVKQYITMMYYA